MAAIVNLPNASDVGITNFYLLIANLNVVLKMGIILIILDIVKVNYYYSHIYILFSPNFARYFHEIPF